MKLKVFLSFALVSFSLSSFVFDNDLCNPVSVTPEEIDSRLPLWFIQTECVSYFKLDHSKFNMENNKDTLIDINIGVPNKYNVMLLESNTSIPQLFFENGVFVPEARHSIKAEFNKISARLQIVLTREEILKGGISYFAVYKTSIKEDYPDPDYPINLNYSIHIKPAENCYWGCEQGTCIDEGKYGQCYCEEGYFDTTCEWPARNITVGKEYFNFWPSPTNHFYLNLADVPSNFKITFNFSGNLTFAFKTNEHNDFSISPFKDKTRVTEDPNGPKSVDFYFDKSELNASNTARLLIEVSFDENYSYEWLEVGIMNDREDPKLLAVTQDSKLPAIVLPILASLIAILVGGIIIFAYKRRQRMNVVNMKNNEELKKGSNHEELKKFFPSEKYSNLKSTLHQPSCSICLEDFNVETMCHQLYCEHIFHEKCIQNWLRDHDKCPNCNSGMTSDAIKKFFQKNEAKDKIEEVIEIHENIEDPQIDIVM